MDKKKVKKLIEQINFIAHDFIDGDKQEVLQDLVSEVQEELNKSDWVSVEDGLPPIGEVVRVRSKQHPNDFMIACRIDENTMKTIYPHRYYSCDVTHWKPIEKLEE